MWRKKLTADAAEYRLDAHDDDRPAARERGERVALEAEPGVAEAHDREEDRLVDVAEPHVVGRRAERLQDEHRPDHPADQAPQALHLLDAVGVHQRELAAQRKAPPDGDEEERAARHEAEAADLHEAEEHDLAGARRTAADMLDVLRDWKKENLNY